MSIELKIEKTKREIVSLINNLSNKYELSFYILHYIIKEIYEEIEKGKNIDIEQIDKELQKMELEAKKGEVENG